MDDLAINRVLSAQADDELAALVQHGAGRTIARTAGAPSPIVLALSQGRRAVAERVAELLELDLYEMAALGDTERLVRALNSAVARGLLSTTREPEGWSPLHLAAFFGGASAVALLIERGAPVNLRSTNAMSNTPLCAALAGEHAVSVAPMLMRAGASVSVVVGGGVTPLHLAASRGLTDIALALVDGGADVTFVMPDGQTAADIARTRGHHETAEVLAALPSA